MCNSSQTFIACAHRTALSSFWSFNQLVSACVSPMDGLTSATQHSTQHSITNSILPLKLDIISTRTHHSTLHSTESSTLARHVYTVHESLPPHIRTKAQSPQRPPNALVPRCLNVLNVFAMRFVVIRNVEFYRTVYSRLFAFWTFTQFLRRLAAHTVTVDKDEWIR